PRRGDQISRATGYRIETDYETRHGDCLRFGTLNCRSLASRCSKKSNCSRQTETHSST
ncbi:unnamed protein product, partial [Caenorhabditis auriculariae]